MARGTRRQRKKNTKTRAATRQVQDDAAYASVRHVSAASAQDNSEAGFWQSGSGALSYFNSEQLFLRSHSMYYLHPLVGRVIDIAGDFMIGDDVKFQIPGDAMDTCMEFWQDPINDFPVQQELMVRDLLIYGEGCYTVHEDQEGNIRLGYIHPYSIERIIPNPLDLRTPIGVKLKSMGTGEQILTTVISPTKTDPQLFHPSVVEQRQGFTITDLFSGEERQQLCFLFQINSQSMLYGDPETSLTSMRGTPEMMALFDPLLSADRILMSMVERADIATRIVWDVSYSGATPAQCQAYASDTPIPDKYTLNVHNEHIAWNRLDVNQGLSDITDLYRTLRNYGLSGRGAGFPEHWFTEGGQTNLATARKMEIAPLKRLKRRQSYVLRMFQRLLSYQLVKKGLNPKELRMIPSPLSEADLHEMSLSLQQLTDSLIKASTEQTQWLSREEAARIYRNFVERFGVRLDPVVRPEYDVPSDELSSEEFEDESPFQNVVNLR